MKDKYYKSRKSIVTYDRSGKFPVRKFNLEKEWSTDLFKNKDDEKV